MRVACPWDVGVHYKSNQIGPPPTAVRTVHDNVRGGTFWHANREGDGCGTMRLCSIPGPMDHNDSKRRQRETTIAEDASDSLPGKPCPSARLPTTKTKTHSPSAPNSKSSPTPSSSNPHSQLHQSSSPASPSYYSTTLPHYHRTSPPVRPASSRLFASGRSRRDGRLLCGL